MSALREILDLLRMTDEAASRLNELAASADDAFLRINAQSLRKRRKDLERRLDQELRADQHDLVSYHIERSTDSYPALAVARAVQAFQELFTAVLDALRTTPKRRYRPSNESIELSAFEFAGAKPGSLNLSMSIPNDRLLLGETDLDRAMREVFRVLEAREQSEFRDLVEAVGIASITKAYAWAEVSSQYRMDTNISWGKSVTDLSVVVIAHDEASRIKEAIEATSDEVVSIHEYEGILVGIDIARPYFNFHVTDGQPITGVTGDGFPKHEWAIEKRYRAKLACTTVIKFSTGEEKTSWTLLELSPV